MVDKKIQIKTYFPQCSGKEQKLLYKLYVNQLQDMYAYTCTYIHTTGTLLHGCVINMLSDITYYMTKVIFQ